LIGIVITIVLLLLLNQEAPKKSHINGNLESIEQTSVENPNQTESRGLKLSDLNKEELIFDQPSVY
jgi:hypothetical protein